MFPGLKPKNIIFSFVITILQISLILSNEERCYSIKNCLKCPELDFCEQCEPGFVISKPKTKCNGNGAVTRPIVTPKKSPVNTPPPKPSPSPVKNENPVLTKPDISVNKAPNNPFQNVPISSFQRFKDKDANNEIINKILIFILIILVLSIIASVIYNFVKKKMNNGYVDDGQEETAKVVYIR